MSACSNKSIYSNEELFGHFLLQPWMLAESSFSWIGSPLQGKGCDGVTLELIARAVLCVVAPLLALIGLILMPFALAIKWFSLQCCAPEIDESRHSPHHRVPRQRIKDEDTSDSDTDYSSRSGGRAVTSSDSTSTSEEEVNSKPSRSHSGHKKSISTNKPVEISSKSQSTVYLRADAFINSAPFNAYGLIGQTDQRHHLPTYLEKITLENEEPLPLDPKGYVILFKINPTETASISIPSNMYLPAILFEGKQNGDTVRLLFKGKLLVLTINQNHKKCAQKGSFEEIFADIQRCFSQNRKKMDPIWANFSDPSYQKNKKDPYRLGRNGSIYKYDAGSERFEHVNKSRFRPKNNPLDLLHNMYIIENDERKPTHFLIIIQHMTSMLEDFDIVINKEYIHFYLRTDKEFDPLSDLQGETEFVKSEESETATCLSSSEGLFSFEWKHYFKDSSLKDMEKKLDSMKVEFKGGIYRFFIPMA